jgi:hypothetical protein
MDEEKKIVTSKQFSLNWMDAAKGLVMSILGAGLTALEQAMESVNSVGLSLNWKHIGIVGATAGIAYILKNFFTKAEEKKSIE